MSSDLQRSTSKDLNKANSNSKISQSSKANSKSDISKSKGNLTKKSSITNMEASRPNSAKNIPTKEISRIDDKPSAATELISTEYYHNRQLDGVFPLFLTSQSQALVKVTIGEDVTDEKMFRMVPKSDLMQDMATRLAISDFTPAKAQIMAYPREEIMVHYDPEYKYTQNFFLVLSAETVDSIILPPTSAEEAGTVEKQDSTQEKIRAPWKSLGSEKEIEMENVKSMGNLVKIRVSRKYSEFKQEYRFGDRDAQDVSLEIKSFKDPSYDLNRMEINASAQAVPEMKTSDSQTAWFRPVNFACQYEPIEMDPADQDEILQSVQLEDFILAISTRLEYCLQQNELLNIFDDDYANLGEEELTIEQGSHTVLQEYQSFTDLVNSKDSCISAIDWHPAQKGVLAVSCSKACGFEEKISQGFSKSSKHSLILEAPEDITCFKIHPSEPWIVAAGCANGQIILWDISQYQEMLKSARKPESDHKTGDELGGESKQNYTPSLRYSVVSSIEASHRGPVTDIHWFPKEFEIGNNGDLVENSENGDKQLVTSSLDGTIGIWDLRYKKDWKALDLAWRPFIRVPLSAMDNSFDYSITKIALKTTIEEKAPTRNNSNPSDGGEQKKVGRSWSSKFYCATEEGDLIYADLIQEKVSEEKASRVESAIGGHFGALSELLRSPFYPDILLTVGGWSFHIWRDKVNTAPLLSSSQNSSGVTCGAWSTSRPGVFYIGRADGMLEVWDLLDKSHSPATVQNVAPCAISAIQIKQYPGKGAQQFIAVGDDAGTLHILETPKNLQKITKNEKAIVGAYFERETKRMLATADRKKNHVKNRAAYEAAALEALNAANKALTKKADDDKPESDENAAELKEEQMYKDMEKAFLTEHNLLAPAAEE